VRIGIDYTAAARQRAGIGRYTRELVTALLALERDTHPPHQYVVFAATGGLDPHDWKRETDRLRAASLQSPSSTLHFRPLPITDDWLARLWHRLRLPIPVETVTGPLDGFYSPDFVLPPTRRASRTLLTVHDLSFLHHPEAFVPALLRYLERVVPRSIARADLVLADSAHTRFDMVSRLGVPPDKVRVLYSGVRPCFQPKPASSGERERLQARYGFGEGPYVLSLGTLQPRKNLARLVEAFAQFEIRNPRTETHLILAGKRGWLYDDLLAQARRLGLEGRVSLSGYVSEEDKAALLSGAVAFMFPSLYEGFGLPVLEAQACGCPVIASNTSSLPEVAGDGALLVDPAESDDIAEAMWRIVADPALREKLVERGFANARRFSWLACARSVLDVIERFVV